MLDTDVENDQSEQLSEKLQVFGSKLARLVIEQTSKRTAIESRWLSDLRQYAGKYPAKVEEKLKQNGVQSKIFVNITRNKTSAAEARLSDMLFPTDDRNWGIKPTPVPYLGMNSTGDDLAAAKQAADEMTKEIEDQLSECNYAAICRDMIHDACVLGTGVIKGPIIVGSEISKWQTSSDGVSILQVVEDYRPSTQYVDPWNFYPDMSAATLSDAEFILERRYLTRKQVVKLARNENYLIDQIRKVLKSDAKSSQASYSWQNEIRAINGVDSVTDHDRYEMWEYNGPISKDEMRSAGIEPDEDDLVEYIGTVHFIGCHVIRVSIHPMDTEDLIYRVFNWEKDTSSIFGYGVPYLMRDQQAVMNSAWRMTLDNAGISTGPQIVVDYDCIEPLDGDWTIKPRKIWKKKKAGVPVDHAFSVYQINCNQQELMSIFTAARQLADEETNLPLIAQGEQSEHITQTAQGMSMLLNSANIVLRRAVKNFDDDVTRPHVQAYYNWNMQFNDKREIKGDFSVDARGSGALIARETQQQRLLQFAQVSAQNPEFSSRTNWDGLYKQIVKHMQISADDVVISDDEFARIQQERAQQPPPTDPIKQAELDIKARAVQSEIEQAQMEFKLKLADHDLRREIELSKLAIQEGASLKEIQSRLGIETMKNKTARDVAAAQSNVETAKIQQKERNLRMGYDTY